MCTTLTQLLLDYRNGIVDYSELLEASIIFVYSKLNGVIHDSKDDWHEFVTSSIHRIESAIAQFVYQGIAFENYLATCLIFYHRTYRTRNLGLQEGYRIVPAFQSEINSLCVYEPENKTLDNYTLDQEGKLSLPKAKHPSHYTSDLSTLKPIQKRIIIYSLKMSASVRECYIEALGEEFNFDIQWLIEKRAEVLRDVWNARLRKQTIEDSCSIWLSRLIDAQRSLKNYEITSSEKVTYYHKKEALARQHLHCISERCRSVDTTPSHDTLARILKLPKGTIDSSIYYLRVYWTKAEPVIKKIINRL